jgi:hypothetical protein
MGLRPCDRAIRWRRRCHRIEGDAANAAYWYRRAGKAAAEGGTDAEGEAIAQALSAR